MSDDFDHMADAWDEAIFHSYSRPARLGASGVEFKPDENFYEEGQPEFQQLIVSTVHRRTEKAVNVSGTVHFDTPYKGFDHMEFTEAWFPLSRCLLTGNEMRVPQWLIRKKWEEQVHTKRQYLKEAVENLRDW